MLGMGWRAPHYAAVLQERPRLDFLEVHSENFFAAGGAAPAMLEQARAHYELSLHGVGLSVGAACGIDADHVERLARLVERVQPRFVSDHACFARVGSGLNAGDLLPIQFDAASLATLLTHVEQVQARLGRAILVENISAYLGWQGDTLAEPEFFNELTRRSGCGLLLDVNNLVVNARNEGADIATAAREACAWIDALRPGCVGEIHLAGHAELADICIDDHGSRVHAEVWRVYAHALARFGRVPSLIEWDTDVPALDVLLDEVALMGAAAPALIASCAAALA